MVFTKVRMQARPNEQTRNSNLDLLAPDPIGLGGEIGTGKNWPISRRKKVCGNAIWGPFLKPPIFLSRQSFCARGEPHSPSGCGPCGSPNSWCEALKKNYSGTKLPPPPKVPLPQGWVPTPPEPYKEGRSCGLCNAVSCLVSSNDKCTCCTTGRSRAFFLAGAESALAHLWAFKCPSCMRLYFWPVNRRPCYPGKCWGGD